jgi:hypothetical protein
MGVPQYLVVLSHKGTMGSGFPLLFLTGLGEWESFTEIDKGAAADERSRTP